MSNEYAKSSYMSVKSPGKIFFSSSENFKNVNVSQIENFWESREIF